MAYPTPTYQAVIHPVIEISDKEYTDVVAERTYAAFRDFLRSNTFMFGSNYSDLGDGRTRKNVYASTSQGVTIDSSADTKRSPFGEVTPDENWCIRLFSFTTPVDDTKKTLVELIKKSANI